MKVAPTMLLLSSFVLGALAQIPPIPAGCKAELIKVCPKGSHTIKNQTGCRDCIKENIAVLKAKDCTSIDAIDYCEPSECAEALDILCHEFRKGTNITLCDDCMKKNLKELEKYECDTLDEINYCKSGYVPPPDARCEPELEKLCGSEKSDHEKCTDCEIKELAELNKAGCDSRDLLKFCTPSQSTCAKQMKVDCSKHLESVSQCEECMLMKQANLLSAGCTSKDETEYCAKAPPGGL